MMHGAISRAAFGSSFRLKSKNWWVLILVFWAAMHLWASRETFMPATMWMRVSVHVNHAWEGEPIVILARRNIQRSSHGVWTASLHRKTPKSWVTTGSPCTGTGSANYTVGSNYPEQVTIE